MATYKIEWKPSAIKELRKLDRPFIPRIIEKVEALSSNPFPSGVRKLRCGEHSYRIRVGDYRVIYTVFESQSTITIFHNYLSCETSQGSISRLIYPTPEAGPEKHSFSEKLNSAFASHIPRKKCCRSGIIAVLDLNAGHLLPSGKYLS